MKGVILCGGQSSRMKKDKGLLPFKGKTWAQLAEEKLSALDLTPVFSINPSQHTTYRTNFKSAQLISDSPELEGTAGPLLGILSVHLSVPSENLLVLACDMLKMEVVVLRELMHQFKANPTIEAICFKCENQIEPLCAIYSASGLAKLTDMHKRKRLRKNSMMHVLEILDVRYIIAENNWGPYFKNFNSVADLK